MQTLTVIATDNNANRNGGRFSYVELERISKLLPNVPVTFDHSEQYADGRGRVKRAWMERGDMSEIDNPPEALAREGYWKVLAELEIEGIEPKAGDGISISTAYKTERCPDCDCDAEGWWACPRPMAKIEAQGFIERVGVADCFELSFVLIPAVKAAKVLGQPVGGTGMDSLDSVPNQSINGDLPMPDKPLIRSSDVVGSEPTVPEVKKPIAADKAPEKEPEKVAEKAIEEAPKVATDSKEPEVKEPEGLTLTPDEIKTMLEAQAARDSQLAELAEESRKLREELEASRKAADAAIKAAKEAELKTRLGAAMPTPSFNTVSSPTSSDKLMQQGLLGEWMAIRDSAETKQVIFDRGTRIIEHRDQAESFQFWKRNKEALRPEIERAAKADGFLMGSRDAATAKSDISSMLLDHLSMLMRTTHQSRRVYWQFPTVVEDFTRGPGDTIQIPRWTYNAEPTATTDYTLTPGTALETDMQNLATSEVSMVLQELGLGKASVSGFEPVGIPEFWMSRSVYSLEQAVMARLGQSYEVCLDHLIRTKYFSTLGVLYNDNGFVTATPGDVGVGDDGTMTQSFLHSVYAYMSGQKVPTWMDGCYGLVMHSTAAGQFRTDIGEQLRPTTMRDVEELTNLLPQVALEGNVVGYLGKYCNFHIFETNAHSLGTNGTEGAQNETFGTGTVLTRSSIAFGNAAVGRGIAMPPQIRKDSNDDFGRLGKFVWLSHEAVGTLDVDPNNDASEQRRVWELRTIDVAV